MQEKYDLIAITTISLLLYGLSYLLVKSGILNKVYHRRFWNTILLVSFLATGILGIYMILQINYDWDISIIDDITFLHVEFGIALFLIAIFHIIWHLSYFLKLFKKSQNKTQDIDTVFFIPENIKPRLKLAGISLGITTFITQIVLLREFITVFSGNELIIGIILSNWLFITGLGAFIGKKAKKVINPIRTLAILQYSLAFLPIITLFLLIYLKNIVFLPGTEVGLTQITFSSFLLLIPLCLFSGFSFSLLSHLFTKAYKSNKIHLTYSFESLGSVFGGLLFNFILIYTINSFQSLSILLMLNVFSASWLLSNTIYNPKIILINITALIIVLSLFYFQTERFVKEFLFVNQKIIHQKNSPYGSVTLTKSGDQINFYQNGGFLFSSNPDGSGNGNIAENEEAVHFAMVQHPSPKEVLLISGGISGQINELLKYPLERIDYLEINPEIINTGEKFVQLSDNNIIHIINIDPRLYLSQNTKKYDIILVNVAEPSTTETNRFYTLEFMKLLKTHLNKNGIVRTQLPSSANYLSYEAEETLSVLYATMDAVFKNILIIPGEKDYFLASNADIDLNIVQKTNKKQIENEYISYYLDDFSIKQRSDLIIDRINKDVNINQDFKPRSYLIQIKSQLSRFKTNYWILAISLLIIFLFITKNMNYINFSMFTGGFASLSGELLILFSFQIIYGNIYGILSFIIMTFMFGLAVGAWLIPKYVSWNPHKSFILTQFILGILIITQPFIFIYLGKNISSTLVNYFIFFTLTLFTSTVAGFEFYLAGNLAKGEASKIAGGIYSADLFGSAIGALLISLFIVPLAGIEYAGIIAGSLSIISGILFKFGGDK
ncbi:MAG: hypothetical protein ABFS35_14370 [Bacteroidota bacterium]